MKSVLRKNAERLGLLSPSPAKAEPLSIARDFSLLVESRMVGPLLPWSARQSLLADGERLGLEPFEANLIIATVQYRRRGVSAPAPAPAKRRGFPYYFTAAVAFEALLLGIAWHFLIG